MQLTTDCQPHSAFSKYFGPFEQLATLFRLTNTPSTFYHSINQVFICLLDHCVVIYLDYILMYIAFTLKNPCAFYLVLQNFSNVNLCTKLKYTFFKQFFGYLEHIIGSIAVHLNLDKLQSIHEWLLPMIYKYIQQFLDIFSYYNKYVHSFTLTMTPLSKLLCKGTVWQQF